MTSQDAAATLRSLAVQASNCVSCRLHEERTNVVFGSGSAGAEVVIVGEGPGKNEDEQGLPFVGRSGDLLEQLLGEIGLGRDDVYISNVVKCRPPKNRDPRPDEIEACKGYLREQLRLIDPRVVVTVGNFSSKLLLRTETGITRLRGKAYEWWGRYLVPTFHPAAALRGSARVLADMRYDFGIVRSVIDGSLPGLQDDAEEQEAPPAASHTTVDPEQLDLFQ